jgi:hypothetical protein
MWDPPPQKAHARVAEITAASFCHALDTRRASAVVTPAFIAPPQAVNATGGCSSSGTSRRQNGGDSCWSGSHVHSRSSCCGSPSFHSMPGSGAKGRRFASLSLGDWRLRLPVLTERSPPYDPWDAASTDAPKGVRRRAAQGAPDHLPAAAASLTQQDAPAASVAPAAAQAPPDWQQQQEAPPHAASTAAADDQVGAAFGKQNGRRSSSRHTGGRRTAGVLPTWLVGRGSVLHRNIAGLVEVAGR